MKAFYFSTTARRLRYADDRPIAVGMTHTIEGAPVLCHHGLHAGRTPWEALQYAPGPILYHVDLGGVIVEGADKIVGTERTYLAEYDATNLLRLFARRQALKHIALIEPYCTSEQYAAVLHYLNTGDMAAAAAARAAAWEAAARAAAWTAAEAAAWTAWARAAWTAAEAAAWTAWARAARAAAEAAAAVPDDMIRAEQAEQFNKMVAEATGWAI